MADNELSNKYGKIYDDMLKGLKEEDSQHGSIRMILFVTSSHGT